MADEGKEKNKGFSALSSLVSNVGDTAGSTTKEGKIESTISEPPQTNHHVEETKRSEQKPKSSDELWVGDTSKKTGKGDGGKWIWGSIIVFVIILLINVENDNKPQASKNVSPPAKSTSTVQPSKAAPSAEPYYTRPVVGNNKVLSIPEIRWCLREGIRIEAIRPVFDTNKGIDKFNSIVEDSNSRCGSFRYRKGALASAERDVEKYRHQIISEAISEARQWQESQNPKHLSASQKVLSEKAMDIIGMPEKPDPQITRKAQQYLTELGYDPGPVDGDYGSQTVNAVKEYQRDSRKNQEGQIDEELVDDMYLALVVEMRSNEYEASKQISNESKVSVEAQSHKGLSNSTPTDYFTRGSHEDDVLRVQGTPTAVNTYSNHEVWHYEYSTVQISTRDSKVTRWNDISGNLKIRMLPGSNTTNNSFFTRGSHQDDVLRVQGTPTAVNTYSNHEVWHYEYSTVQISTRDRKVTKWNDISGNLKIRMLPGSNTTNNSYFTRGSYQDDVLRVQGTPTAVNTYSNHEVWHYEYSTVQISTRDSKVTKWNDISGNLKIRMLPGSNTTNNSFFTRGSHQDDVLRVQGTPTAINTYSNHEEWKYEYSTVQISTRDSKVTRWNDISGNLKIRMLPGSNTTNNSFFTRGSHQDDVLRVQGTPTAINTYSNHEVWHYEYSTVQISTRDRKVTKWNNISVNLLVK